MRSPINTFARGLLALLGVQTGGRVPIELEDGVRATLELFPFYSLALANELYDATGAVVLAGDDYPNLNGVLTVPQGEMWYVHRFTVEAAINLPAGETNAIAPALYTVGPAGAGITPWCLFPHSTFGAGQRPFVKAVEGFWMRPGNRLGIYVPSVVAATGTVAYELKALVSRLTI